MSGRSLMGMKKFATINTAQAATATSVAELIRLGETYNVNFVPYRPVILKALLDIIPNKVTGEKFTQKTFAEVCTETAKNMGIKARGGKPLQITQRTVSNYCNPKEDGTKPDSDVLEVMSEVLGVFLVPGLDRTVSTERILEHIKNLYQ